MLITLFLYPILIEIDHIGYIDLDFIYGGEWKKKNRTRQRQLSVSEEIF